MRLHESELQIVLNTRVETAYVRLVAGARFVLQKLDVGYVGEADAV
jgi:hypothetical protein